MALVGCAMQRSIGLQAVFGVLRCSTEAEGAAERQPMEWCRMQMDAAVCPAPTDRRERGFFDVCLPGVRLRSNGPDVGPTAYYPS